MRTLIKNDDDYETVLNRINEIFDAKPNTSEMEELELLTLLIEKYEENKFPINLPDPIDAIKFRMEQDGLKQKDLVQYIGTKSKVSEVLNGKRPLSLAMIRNLNQGLNIPAEVLLKEKNKSISSLKYNIEDFPFTEMYKRGYLKSEAMSLSQAKEHAEELLVEFHSEFEGISYKIACKTTKDTSVSLNSLKVWSIKVLKMCDKKLPKFKVENINQDFLQRLVNLSYYDDGISLVKAYLNKIGIYFKILEHLPKTHLDGACFFHKSGNPVIALTLRYDRLDNFWFTLMHELGHIKLKHIKQSEVILDNICNEQNTDIEIKANNFANKTMINDKLWIENKSKLINEKTIIQFAKSLGISIAIVAAKVRWETNDYKKYYSLLGAGSCKKKLFQNINNKS